MAFYDADSYQRLSTTSSELQRTYQPTMMRGANVTGGPNCCLITLLAPLLSYKNLRNAVCFLFLRSVQPIRRVGAPGTSIKRKNNEKKHKDRGGKKTKESEKQDT